jgi:hypothetical protein
VWASAAGCCAGRCATGTGRGAAAPGVGRLHADLLQERFAEWALTPSEKDVALFAIKGLSTAEIAAMRSDQRGHGQGADQCDLSQGGGDRAVRSFCRCSSTI